MSRKPATCQYLVEIYLTDRGDNATICDKPVYAYGLCKEHFDGRVQGHRNQIKEYKRLIKNHRETIANYEREVRKMLRALRA